MVINATQIVEEHFYIFTAAIASVRPEQKYHDFSANQAAINSEIKL